MLGESAYFVDEASKVPMWCAATPVGKKPYKLPEKVTYGENTIIVRNVKTMESIFAEGQASGAVRGPSESN
jgi:hypothetical protein